LKAFQLLRVSPTGAPPLDPAGRLFPDPLHCLLVFTFWLYGPVCTYLSFLAVCFLSLWRINVFIRTDRRRRRTVHEDIVENIAQLPRVDLEIIARNLIEHFFQVLHRVSVRRRQRLYSVNHKNMPSNVCPFISWPNSDRFWPNIFFIGTQ